MPSAVLADDVPGAPTIAPGIFNFTAFAFSEHFER